jgi:hypothetical protein
MAETLSTESTSLHTANVDPIVLRETKTTRLLFQPQLVDNARDERASVRGAFVYQRRRSGEEWAAIESAPLSKLHSGEQVKLELHGEEVLKLVSGLQDRYALYERCGIQLGVHEYAPAPDEVVSLVAAILSSDETRRVLLNEKSGDLLCEIAAWAGKAANPEALVRQLVDLDPRPLAALHLVTRVAELTQAVETWDTQRGNGDERYWQEFFVAHPWLLSSLFGGEPLIYAGERVYVGGKDITGTGGSYADFLYENGLSHCLAVVEIKTPLTQLLGKKYRDGVWPFSQQLIGAVGQVLSQRHALSAEFDHLVGAQALRPYGMRAVVVAGRLDALGEDEEVIRSFELLRHQLGDVDVVTYDELFEKARGMLGLVMLADDAEPTVDEGITDDDVPF